MFPVMIVVGTTAKVLVGGGPGGACTGMGDDASLSSTGGSGSMDARWAMSALRAATIGWRSKAGFELVPTRPDDGACG